MNVNEATIKVVASDESRQATFSGDIGGLKGNLTKTGKGTLILSGTNTYTGKTVVKEGVLQVSALNNLDSRSDLSVYKGAKFKTSDTKQKLMS